MKTSDILYRELNLIDYFLSNEKRIGEVKVIISYTDSHVIGLHHDFTTTTEFGVKFLSDRKESIIAELKSRGHYSFATNV